MKLPPHASATEIVLGLPQTTSSYIKAQTGFFGQPLTLLAEEGSWHMLSLP